MYRPSEPTNAPGRFFVPRRARHLLCLMRKNIRKSLDFSSVQSVNVTTQSEWRNRHDTANDPRGPQEMVQAISERLNSPAVYLRTPTYAYRIGGLTVERDGSIDSDDEALLETLRPMLIERGWLTDAAAADSEAAADQESGEGAVVNAGSEATAADYASAAKDSESTDMELSFPVEDWTVAQLNNLLRTLYSNQYILRRMMRGDALYIDRLLMERLDETPAETLADFEAMLADGLATGMLRGCRVQDGRFTSRRCWTSTTPPAGRCMRRS